MRIELKATEVDTAIDLDGAQLNLNSTLQKLKCHFQSELTFQSIYSSRHETGERQVHKSLNFVSNTQLHLAYQHKLECLHFAKSVQYYNHLIVMTHQHATKTIQLLHVLLKV